MNFLRVPREAIVKPEDERPIKTVKRPEEELPGNENTHDDEGIDDTVDMDEDGSPDWDHYRSWSLEYRFLYHGAF